MGERAERVEGAVVRRRIYACAVIPDPTRAVAVDEQGGIAPGDQILGPLLFEGLDAIARRGLAGAIIDLRLRRGSGREVVVSMPPNVPVIIFSGLRSESADLETVRPLTRLVEKPYSLVMLMDTLERMLEQARAIKA